MAVAHVHKSVEYAKPVHMLSPVICVHCFHTIGSPRNARERARMEAKHVCEEKLQSKKPSVSVPYN
jgi:hypothetical protein